MPAVTHTVRRKRTQRADVFGHIPGIEVGAHFDSRQACSDAAVHSGIVAGIHGNKELGAFSVVLSGGYEDDDDKGDEFIYIGCGGRDTGGDKKRRMGPQVFDQTFDHIGNNALKRSADLPDALKLKRPVRVVRGHKLDSGYAPSEGYRYDGLYIVTSAWREMGRAGFLVCKFHLQRIPGQPPIPTREKNTRNVRLSIRDVSPLPEPKFEGKPLSVKPERELAQVASTSSITMEKSINQPPVRRALVFAKDPVLAGLKFKKKTAPDAERPIQSRPPVIRSSRTPLPMAPALSPNSAPSPRYLPGYARYTASDYDEWM